MIETPQNAVLSEPANEPVSLIEAKEHCFVAQNDDTHDLKLRMCIVAARQQFEDDTNSLTVSRTVTENLSEWPQSDWRFYYRPIVSVDSVQYYDANNTQQTLATSVYTVDAPNRRLLLGVDETWPTITSRFDAITITYTAGQTLVSEIAKAAILLQVDILFDLRGMHKDKDAHIRAYENLVSRYHRPDYP